MTVETGSAILEDAPVQEPTQCDACGVARAMWKVVGPSGSYLLMCGHHKTIHEASLASWALEMIEVDSST